MPRRKKATSFTEDQIRTQEALVQQLKKQYELELETLRELIQQDSAEKRERLMLALQNSPKSFDEILEFLNGGSTDRKFEN